ncbi:MAG: ComEA family DNA-binding protein [Pseudomonadota bacterium]
MKKWIVLSAWVLGASFWAAPSYAVPQATAKTSAVAADARKSLPRININTADAKTLDEGLLGVGPAKAQAIIDWRKQKGPFKTVAGLMAVKGMGASLIERNKDRLSVR